MTVSGYTGTAGDSMSSHTNMKFSTHDNDQDTSSENCASVFKGAWWYHTCHSSNPNGQYLHGIISSYGDGVIWYEFKGHYYSLKTIEFKIRRL